MESSIEIFEYIVIKLDINASKCRVPRYQHKAKVSIYELFLEFLIE